MMAKDEDVLAVLIDADNLGAKYAEAILIEARRYGELALRQVYGDWSSDNLKGWREAVPKLGLVAIQATANTAKKNASDIGLVIGAMDILHSQKFDGFVLVSSDSDFTALAHRLREDGAKVVGIGGTNAPDSLCNACNRFVSLNDIHSEEKVNCTTKATSNDSSNKTQTNKASTQPPSKIVPLILKAMRSREGKAGWYCLSALGSWVKQENPDFNLSMYGSGKLNEVLKNTGQFDVLQTDQNGFKVRCKSQCAR